MKELPERIHDDTNGLDYVLVGDYYIPALRLTEESRPIGHWGRRRKAYLEEVRPALYCRLSKDDGTNNENMSISTQDAICQG